MSNDNDIVVGICNVHLQPGLLGTSMVTRNFRYSLTATFSVGKIHSNTSVNELEQELQIQKKCLIYFISRDYTCLKSLVRFTTARCENAASS